VHARLELHRTRAWLEIALALAAVTAIAVMLLPLAVASRP